MTNKLKIEGLTGAYETWLAAQVMQAVLRSGKFPLKTNDAALPSRIICEISRKWGLTCRIDYDKSDLLPVRSFSIVMNSEISKVDIAYWLQLIDRFRSLLCSGSISCNYKTREEAEEAASLLEKHFDITCRVEDPADSPQPVYLIVRL